MKAKISEGKKTQKFDNIVIDARNQVFKYQHTMKYLKTHSGIETGIYHGFLSLVLRLRQENMDARIIVAWEGGNLARKQQLSTYKDKRPKSKDSFEARIKNLKDMLGMLGVEQAFAPGYEADDIAAIITSKEPEAKTLLVSEDRDWYQALKQNTSIMKKNKIYSYKDIHKQEGFNPERFGLYVLLKGKKGNNVEGIPFFPTKLARDIIKNCSSIKQIIAYKNNIQPKDIKWMELLKISKKELIEKFEIVRLRDDVKMEDVKCHERNKTHLKKLLKELEMFKVLSLMKTVRRLKKSR